MSENYPIRVALVDDHSIVRRGLSAVLTTTDQLELVGEAENGDEAIKLCERNQPDVVLMDLIMPGMDGIEATRAIHQRWPAIQVLVLTSFTEQEMIQGALDAGARGYLLKNVKGRDLIEAIIQVHQGGQTIAQEARKTLHLSEQLSMLEEELDQDNLSTTNITETLNKHLPHLFPDFRIHIRIFPNQDFFISEAKGDNFIPKQGWDWLQSSGEEKVIFYGEKLPWGSTQDTGKVLLLTPIQGKNQRETIGGIGLMSGDTAPKIDDLVKISSSLAVIIASVDDRIHTHNLQLSGGQLSEGPQKTDRVQSRILPEHPPVINGWEIASRLVAASGTSGDYYDFIPLADDKWGILIANVTEMGPGAAVFMAMCSALIRTYAIRFPNLPALAFSSVNERILSDMRGGLSLDAFYGVLKPLTGQLKYVNAGQNPPPLLVGKNNNSIDKLTAIGAPLGVSNEGNWQQETVTFSPGDVLIMYTNGITKAHNKDGDNFGESNLQQVIASNQGQPAEEILDAILDEVEDFTGGDTIQNDLALVVLSRKN